MVVFFLMFEWLVFLLGMIGLVLFFGVYVYFVIMV